MSNPILESKLSLDSDTPLYAQLVSIVKRHVSAGALKPGDLLPSEAELCTTFGISRSTVRQAIGVLETEGLVVRKQGRGTFIAEPKMRKRSETVFSFTSEISAMGLTPSSTLLEFEVMQPTEEVVRKLELPGSQIAVYRFVRIRNVEGEPLIIETSYYPQYIYPKLTRELLQTHSFYSLLYEVGVVPASAHDRYQAVMLNQREAELLHAQPGSCGFLVERSTRTETGLLYEFTTSLIRGDRVKLDVMLNQRDGVAFKRKLDY